MLDKSMVSFLKDKEDLKEKFKSDMKELKMSQKQNQEQENLVTLESIAEAKNDKEALL